MSEYQPRSGWHRQAVINLSRLSLSMTENFTEGHDVEQTDEYNRVYEEYLQLKADRAQHDAFDSPTHTDHRDLG